RDLGRRVWPQSDVRWRPERLRGTRPQPVWLHDLDGGRRCEGRQSHRVDRRAWSAGRRRSRPLERSACQHSGAARVGPYQADVSILGPGFPSDRRRREDRPHGEAESMNRATLVLVIASFAFAADDTELVHEAALGWTAAAVKQDTAALQRFLADDLQYA